MKKALLLVFTLLLTYQSAAAQDVQVRYGCRRGVPRPVSMTTRGDSEGHTPGGNFYKGNLHQLVVMVEFADRAFKGDEAATLAQWEKILIVLANWRCQ